MIFFNFWGFSKNFKNLQMFVIKIRVFTRKNWKCPQYSNKNLIWGLQTCKGQQKKKLIIPTRRTTRLTSSWPSGGRQKVLGISCHWFWWSRFWLAYGLYQHNMILHPSHLDYLVPILDLRKTFPGYFCLRCRFYPRV